MAATIRRIARRPVESRAGRKNRRRIAIAIDTQALLGDGSSGHVTAHPFELGALVRLTAGGAVEREAITGAGEGLGQDCTGLGGQQGVL